MTKCCPLCPCSQIIVAHPGIHFLPLFTVECFLDISYVWYELMTKCNQCLFHCPFLNQLHHFLYFPLHETLCHFICLCALHLISFKGLSLVSFIACPIPSFSLTYCVCFSFLAVAVGWQGHLHSRWLYIGQRKHPHLSGAWVRWV